MDRTIIYYNFTGVVKTLINDQAGMAPYPGLKCNILYEDGKVVNYTWDKTNWKSKVLIGKC